MCHHRGFTLIELSIVLVIIALVVGGILVGQDLIRGSAARAQMAQVESYSTAAHVFRGKYGYLPGDIKDPEASNLGFAGRGQYAGQGDGNGLLEANYVNAAGFNYGTKGGEGETSMFWVDLSVAKLIDGSFGTASAITVPASSVSGTGIQLYMPPAKIGNGNYVYVWSGGWNSLGPGTGNGVNYFGLSAITMIEGIGGSVGRLDGSPKLTVMQAYSIDKKMDDGYPQTGRVIALYVNGNIGAGAYWAAGGGAQGASSGNAPTTAATAGSATTCYDNGSLAGALQQYSVKQNSGAGANCALSFQFQ